MARKRAAVVIGVDKIRGLTPLRSAAKNANEIANWLGSSNPGYDVSLFEDSTKPVKYSDIEDAVFKYAALPTRYELLLVYFSGHGLFLNRSDIWLLSNAPGRANECVNLKSAVDQAKYCGIPNVVFISDACRSLPEDLAQANLNGGFLFPTHPEIENSTTKVDSFRATGRGTPAYEGVVGDAPASFLTHAFRLAYKKPRTEMVHPLKILSKTVHVVPNRRLEVFLQETIDSTIADVDDRLEQQIEVSVPSDDLIFIAPADDRPTAEAAPATTERSPGTSSAGSQPLSVSLPKARNNNPDKLTELSGIGPARERALNDVGVYHLDQIADMPAKDARWLDGNLGNFKGLAERYNWKREAERALESVVGDAAPGPPPAQETPVVESVARIGRAAADRVVAELSSDTSAPNASVELRSQIDDELAARTPTGERDAFESETGLLVHGVEVESAVIGAGMSGAWLEILENGVPGTQPGIVRFWDVEKASSAAIKFKDGRSILIPALRGFIAHAHIGPAGMKTLNFVPSANSRRYSDYLDKRERVDKLRASVALASDHGSFQIGSSEKAREIARRVRMGKASDPTLGVYAAHAYWEASEDDAVKSVQRYMRSDLFVDLFDVWMLAHRWPEKNKTRPVYPACPMMTQGWSLVKTKDVELAPAVRKAGELVSNALWTTFQPGAFDILSDALNNGDIQ